MENRSKFTPPSEATNGFASSEIVGSFCIKNHHYLVIAIEHELEFTQFEQVYAQTLHTAAIGQFEANGQRFLIVEANSHVSATQSDAISRLTERELQIVRLVASGCPNKQIAKQLCISEWTVSTHLRRIFAKLGVDSRAAMVYQCASLID